MNRRILFLAALLAFLAAPARAQQGLATEIRSRSTDLTTCTTTRGWFYWNSTTHEMKACPSSNAPMPLAWTTLSNVANSAVGSTLKPGADAQYDLGSASFQWRDIYLSGSLVSGAAGMAKWEGGVGSCTAAPTGKGKICFSSTGNRPVYSYDGGSSSNLLLASDPANRRVCDIGVGDTSASTAITDGQLGPQKRVCFIPAASTVVEVDVDADAGTPNVIVGYRNPATTLVNLLSGALATGSNGVNACSNAGGTTGIDGTTTCSNTLQNTAVAAGGFIELVSGTAGGTAKWMTVHVIYTIN